MPPSRPARSFETTAHSIAWALYEVAADPRVQAALEEELQGAGLLGAGRRPLEYGDLAALPYLNAVLKEAMRLHPVASNGTARWGEGGAGWARPWVGWG